MSVLIKGMAMPKPGRYEAVIVVLDESTAEIAISPAEDDIGYWKEYPLVPVPPHGDLVDRDEMFVEFVIEGQKTTRYKVGEKWELNGEEIRRAIQRLPAVIPAEEGE